VIASLRSHGAGPIADDLVEPVRRSVSIFGAHLCGLDLRQNSAVHEAVLADLFAEAGVCDDYLGLGEADRVELLEAEMRTPRLLRHPDAGSASGRCPNWPSSRPRPRRSPAWDAGSCRTT
jgi:phosphoenolpyruvate carboxylase